MYGYGFGSFLSGNTATWLKNKVQSNTQYPGEKNILMRTPKGIQFSSYCGPGTAVEKRVREGSEPLVPEGKVCQAHDIRYSLGHDYNDIRQADEKLVDTINKMDTGQYPRYSKINTFAIKNAIKAKNFGEDIGFLSKDAFTGIGNPDLTADDKRRLENKLHQLETEGYGYSYPAEYFLQIYNRMSPEKQKHVYQKAVMYSRGVRIYKSNFEHQFLDFLSEYFNISH